MAAQITRRDVKQEKGQQEDQREDCAMKTAQSFNFKDFVQEKEMCKYLPGFYIYQEYQLFGFIWFN